MVKLKGPLMSLGAHGSLDKILTYAGRKSGHQTRKYSKPTGTASAKQRAQRRLTEFLVAQWQNMTDDQKGVWETAAKTSDKRLSGYHYFLRETQRDLYTHSGLCGYWHFNEIVGGKVLDISGNGNNGTLGPDYPTDAPTLEPSASKRLSKALRFDAATNSVDCGNNSILNPVNAMTFTMWIYITNTADHNVMITRWKAPGAYFFCLDNDTSLLKFFINDAGVSEVSTKELSLNEWHSIAAVYNGASIVFFDNGAIMPSTTSGVIPSSIDSNTGKTSIGYDLERTSHEFKGLIDEVCLYNRALSAAEIATRYDFATRKV